MENKQTKIDTRCPWCLAGTPHTKLEHRREMSRWSKKRRWWDSTDASPVLSADDAPPADEGDNAQ